MRTLTTFCLILFFTSSLFAQYSINQIYPSDGQLCSGLIVYSIGSEAGQVSIDLLFIESDQSETLVNNRYNWSGAGYFDKLCPGDYILRISDSFGCSKDLHFTIEGECNEIQMIREPDIYPASSCEPNGQIQFGGPDPTGHFFSGLIDPVEFEWSNGKTGPIIKDISSGNYQLTVTDAKLCSKSFQLTVPGDNEVITVQTFSTPTCAGMALGEAAALASSESTSGPVEYLFFWPHNQQTDRGTVSALMNAEAGTYTVNVSNLDGSCPISAQVTVEALQQNEPLQFILGQSKPSCDNRNNGTVEINISGGVPDYKITSSKGIPYLSGSQVVQLSSGEQTLTLTDFCGNSVSQEINVDSWEPLNVFITEKGFENCDPNKGIIRFEGNKSFTVRRHSDLFNSQPVPNSSNQHFVKYGYTSAGEYDFYVTDENGCSYSFIDVELEQPGSISTEAPTFLQEALNCNEGNIYVPVFGGSPPYSFTWEMDDEIVSTENFLSGTEHGIYVLTVKDACLRVAKKVIDFSCICTSQFQIEPTNPCNNDGTFPKFKIDKIDDDEVLKPGTYHFEWITPPDEHCYLKVGADNSEKWSGRRKIVNPLPDITFRCELNDPRGCFSFIEFTTETIAQQTYFPVSSNFHDPSLAFWTQNEDDGEIVATDCWSGLVCNGFQEEGTASVKFHYQPFSYDYPCAGGTITCPNDPLAKFVITVEGQPYSIATGTEKCGCLWEIQDLPYSENNPTIFENNLPILAVFDCDGEDIDISIIYNSCEGEVTTNQVAPCTYDYSCDVNGTTITWPASYTPEYCLAIVDCKMSQQSDITYYIFEHCDDFEDCSDAFRILDYQDRPFGQEGITEIDMTEYRDEGRCGDIINKHYRKFCEDPNYLSDCPVGPCLSNWLAHLPENDPPITICSISNPGFTDDPPSEGYPGNTGGYGEGQEESSSTAIQLFPNPTTGATTLQFTRDPRESSYQITIFDTYGNPLFEKMIDYLEEFDQVNYYIEETAGFPPGIYFVEVYGIEFMEKLVDKLTVQ